MVQPLKVAVVPASTRTGAAVIRSLFQQATEQSIPVSIRAFYRNLDKVPEDFRSKRHFEAIKGDVADVSTLDFSGIDSVVTATPPAAPGAQDMIKEAEMLSRNVSEAIEITDGGHVKKLVLLSSMGAHLDYGVGEIKTNNAAEKVFRSNVIPLKTFVRCAYFMENWTMFADNLKSEHPFFYSTITPLEYAMPMVAIADIGDALAREALNLSDSKRQPHIYELQGPRDYTPLDAQAALTKAVGKEVEIREVKMDDFEEFYGSMFPPHVAAEWVEMTKSVLPGGVAVENPPPGVESGVIRGKLTLNEAIAKACEGL